MHFFIILVVLSKQNEERGMEFGIKKYIQQTILLSFYVHLLLDLLYLQW